MKLKKYSDFLVEKNSDGQSKAMVKIVKLIDKEVNLETAALNSRGSRVQFISEYEVDGFIKDDGHSNWGEDAEKVGDYDDDYLYLYMHIDRPEVNLINDEVIKSVVSKYIPEHKMIVNNNSSGDRYYLWIFKKEDFFNQNLIRSFSGMSKYNITESYTEQEFLDRKDEILKMKEIIIAQYKKHHVDLKNKDVVIANKLNTDQEEIVQDMDQKNYNVFFKIFFDNSYDVGGEYLKEYLEYFMPTANLYWKQKEKDYLSQMYIIALNFDETMNDNTYRSHRGLNKYKV
jgi:hypothetical protein